MKNLIEKNVEEIRELREKMCVLSKKQEENLEIMKALQITIASLQEKIKKNNEFIQEARQKIKACEKNVRFMLKHPLLNRVSGVLAFLGLPVSSIKVSQKEIEKNLKTIKNLEEENKGYQKELSISLKQNMELMNENEEITKRILEVTDLLEEKSKITTLESKKHVESVLNSSINQEEYKLQRKLAQ